MASSSLARNVNLNRSGDHIGGTRLNGSAAAPFPIRDTISGLADSSPLYASVSVAESPLFAHPFAVRSGPIHGPSYAKIARAIPDQPVCIGDGLDVPALGLLSTLVLPTIVGLCIWLLFAILRPRFRQVYGVREWFAPRGLRPAHLSHSFWAFLLPGVPIKPSLSIDRLGSGESAAKDAHTYPSDEELSQRTLWITILIVSGWTILGVGGLLPLYMAALPCLAHSTPPFEYHGQYSTLQDLSLLRLLQSLPTGTDFSDHFLTAPYVRVRLIILVIIAVLLALAPALWLILREYNKLVDYRERWVSVRCHGVEMGWLGAGQAPGVVGWGEKRLKEFIIKNGLSSSMEVDEGTNGHPRRQRKRRAADANGAEKATGEVDIQNLFSIGDTTEIALLIDERDEILENLEIAETKYVQSFRFTTPEPSLQFQLPTISEEPNSTMKLEISRPRPLASAANGRKRRRGRNPASGSSSLPPTSYVMPSQYYKLRGVRGVNGGHLTDVERDVLPSMRGPSLAESINSRVVGSRFQEVNASSPTIGLVPMGSQVTVNKDGQLEAVRAPDSPYMGAEPGTWAQDDVHSSWDTAAFHDTPYNPWINHSSQDHILNGSEEDWHDVLNEDPEAFQNAEEYPEDTRRRPRPPRAKDGVNAHRESFPLRNRNTNKGEELPPPHLRLQPHQPFVKPVSGVDHRALGEIYENIGIWRSRLKAINAQISEAQRIAYNDIADGVRIKGWLMIGRGLRFIPGIQLIEGRAKEDIRWDELQNEGGFARTLGFWTAAVMISIILAVILMAVAALYLSTAPDFAHYFPFLMRLDEGNELGAGVATCLAAALAAVLFIWVVLAILHYFGPLYRTASLSHLQLVMFKTTFWVLILVGGASFFTAGALLSAMHSFSTSIGVTASVADGIVYMSAFALILLLTVAVSFPGLLLLQPLRLWRVFWAEKAAITSRQRFRAVYPRTYNPSYTLSCAVLAFTYAMAFTLLFPPVAPAALLLLSLALIAHRFLVTYVYGRTTSSTGGLLQIWLLRRFSTLLAVQPLILGLVFLSRELWVEGGILCGFALFVVIFTEGYCNRRTIQPGKQLLNPITLDRLQSFIRMSQPGENGLVEEERLSVVGSGRHGRSRGSFASILEMLSLTLAVVPTSSETRGPIPLGKWKNDSTLDDLTATERAARTNPEAPPHLPPLPFADHAEEMASILYAPELLAPPPVIWLPNDTGGIGRSEAYDLQRYHELRVTQDVRAKEDATSRRSWT
ncbi:uncharacterized protein LAESUDRAFT_661940 [Laetiporus sulphureus 93-53]|uniref:CSC1/OSCA1-like 7TM region domain-containing protein n=1 Tax=Laetiporus sulphureus 93-53 TaxID=1314785 RepID=A0A165CBG1_9APHY|nr:uncharacterized protein LAESUDRAFT_661940 [Laetiporus sulphureus 93-53]KZT02505.1 hypothetical protein LAESUDRAFT_661940 [Laetiporus sulphureus 93-53]